WPASSPAVSSGLAVVTAPPAAMAPYRAIAYSGRLGLERGGSAPLPKPPPATALRARGGRPPPAAAGELPVGQGPPGGPVDQRRLVPEAGRVLEHELGRRDLPGAHGGGGAGPGLKVAHGLLLP